MIKKYKNDEKISQINDLVQELNRMYKEFESNKYLAEIPQIVEVMGVLVEYMNELIITNQPVEEKP